MKRKMKASNMKRRLAAQTLSDVVERIISDETNQPSPAKPVRIRKMSGKQVRLVPSIAS